MTAKLSLKNTLQLSNKLFLQKKNFSLVSNKIWNTYRYMKKSNQFLTLHKCEVIFILVYFETKTKVRMKVIEANATKIVV